MTIPSAPLPPRPWRVLESWAATWPSRGTRSTAALGPRGPARPAARSCRPRSRGGRSWCPRTGSSGAGPCARHAASWRSWWPARAAAAPSRSPSRATNSPATTPFTSSTPTWPSSGGISWGCWCCRARGSAGARASTARRPGAGSRAWPPKGRRTSGRDRALTVSSCCASNTCPAASSGSRDRSPARLPPGLRPGACGSVAACASATAAP